MEHVAQAMARGTLKGDVKRLIAEKAGEKLHPSTVEKVLKMARESIASTVGREEADYLRAESLEFYRSITRNPESSDRDKIAARVQIDRLLGLELPPAPPEPRPLPTEIRVVVADAPPSG